MGSSPPSPTPSMQALMHQHHSLTHPYARSQGSTKNARTSAQKSNNSAGGGNGQDRKRTTGPTNRHVTGKANTSKRPSATPIVRESRRHLLRHQASRT